MEGEAAISELSKLEHDIKHGFSSSSGQEQGPVTDLICSDDLIYSVPTDMANMANKEQQHHAFEKEMPFNLFSPCIVSIGPLNFNLSSSSLLMGNEIKKEAFRKMTKDYEQFIKEKPGFLTKLIQQIEKCEKEIKECYADRAKIPVCLSGSTFASIMLLDSCFLLQLHRWVSGEMHLNKDEWPRLATVFEDRHMKAMVIQDIFKIGNQIPLFVVRHVAKAFKIEFGYVIAETLLNICPLSSDLKPSKLASQVDTLCSNKKAHFLSLLHRFMCDSLAGEKPNITGEEGHQLADTVLTCFRCCMCCCAWFAILPKLLFACQVDAESATDPCQVASAFVRVITCYLLFMALILVAFALSFLLVIVTAIVTPILGLGVVILLVPFFIIACLWPHHRMKQQEASRPWFRAKAEILAHHISIKSYPADIKGISYTRDNSSLCLPRIEVGETSCVVLHNMIAMERCSQRVDKKTVCNYAILMAKLLQTPTDVEVLEDRKVLTGMCNDRSWTVRMFQDLQESAVAEELRFWDWTDGCLQTLRQLQELPEPSRLAGIRISMMFWVKDLGRRYAANPWVALSTAAAAILLLMTAAQVVCLFVNCSSSRRRSSPPP